MALLHASFPSLDRRALAVLIAAIADSIRIPVGALEGRVVLYLRDA